MDEIVKQQKLTALRDLYAEIDAKNHAVILKNKIILDKVFGPENTSLTKVITNVDSYSDSTLVATKQDIKERLKNHCYYLIIRFPKVEITNTKKQFHTIHDLFVRITFGSSMNILGDIYGMRTTFSSDEWSTGYTHSHLSGINTSFSPFCLGTGPIKQLLLVMYKPFTPEMFQVLCYHLNNYVRWESIEGNPYHYLESVKGVIDIVNINSSVSFDNWILDKSTVFDYIIHHISPTTIKELFIIRLGDYDVSIQATSLLEKYIAIQYQKLYALYLDRANNDIPFSEIDEDDEDEYLESLDHFIAQKNSQGQYFVTNYDEGDQIDRSSLSTKPLIVFKKQEYFLKIENSLDEKKEIKTYYAHPNLTKEFIRYFSDKFEKEIHRISRDKTEKNKIADLAASPATNQTPVRGGVHGRMVRNPVLQPVTS